MIDPFGRAEAKFRVPATGPRNLMHPGWPESTPTVELLDGSLLRLRPLTSRDAEDWRQARLVDISWLKPVEPTTHGSWTEAHTSQAWRNQLMNLRDQATRGAVVPMVIEIDGKFAGQVTLGNLQHGGISECWIGYWVHSPFMGKSVATAACALGTDHAFSRVGLHRVTATYLPSNPASGKVLKSTGFRAEGYLRRNLHINGEWRDHHFVAQVIDDHSETCVARLRATGRIKA